MQDFHPLEATGRTENVLRTLGRKVGSGSQLTLAENLMAMTAAAQATQDNYGPGPEQMEVRRPELPESVKGVLANYVS